MLWGPDKVDQWWSDQGSWPSTVKNVLFVNEPELSSQSNIAAGDAVALWMNNYLPQRAQGRRLGSSAASNGPDGLQWIQDLKTLCVQYGNSQADCTPE